jgi:hypothetical protein
MFIRNPNKSNMNWDNFLKPFSTGLWMAILGVILVLSAFYYIGIKIGRKYNEESEGVSTFRLYDSVLYIYYSFCQQGKYAVRLITILLTCRCNSHILCCFFYGSKW